MVSTTWRHAPTCSALAAAAVMLSLLGQADAAPATGSGRQAPVVQRSAVALPPAGDHAQGAAKARVSAPTQVHRVSPTNRSGELKRGYRVVSTRRGYCWTVSDLNPALFRCFWKNLIEDPCWPEAGEQSVLCLARPWGHRLMRLRLTKRLPEPMQNHSALWGLTTASGNNCQFAAGAREWFHGRPVSYYCARRWVLIGAPDRSEPTWRMRAARRYQHRYHARGWHRLADGWRAKAP
jgi:hypothetical protein